MTPHKRQTHRQPHSPLLTVRCSAFLSACLRGLCVESVTCYGGNSAWHRIGPCALQSLWMLGVVCWMFERGGWRFQCNHATMQHGNHSNAPTLQRPSTCQAQSSLVKPKKIN